MNLNVLYEDNHLLVVVKPHGVLSQSDITGDEDMLSICREYIREKYNKPGEAFLGLVHRLDRPTGGVMVFARTSKAAARLSKQMYTGEFEKTYLAVLIQKPPQKQGELTDYLQKDEETKTSKVVSKTAPGAKEAKLEYTVLDEKNGFVLVRVKLLTGRFHQIRAQLDNIGCSVYGDMKYGKRNIKDELALFASEVCLTHPTKKERMCFTANPENYPFDIFDSLK